jgi:chorismate synthase
VGGIVECQILGAPGGLGDPVFDKLDALLAHAMLSIGTIKGIEFGSGFAAVEMFGSQSNDVFYTNTDGKVATQTNHAGGILGGISTGQPIVFRVAVKPPSSITKAQQTVNIHGKTVDIEVKGRHDPCICPRVVPVVEAMTAIVMLDRVLVQKTIR